MITLITGAPGAGKSAALVDLLAKLQKGRVLYVDGVPDLTLPHFDLADSHQWHEVVPDGAAVVIDEVQRVWRPRGPGQKVPADIAALETHRHRGIDFFIVTQSPALVDKNVRALVGRHIHLRDVGVLGRHWYEWPECSENIAWKTAPLKKRYTLPKSAFSLYKSASVHVKPIRSFPMAIVFAAVAIVGIGFFGYKAVAAVKTKMAGTPPPAAAQAPASAASGPAGVASPSRTRRAIELRREAEPVIPSQPNTAPMYDRLRVVVNMPRIVGGYCQSGACTCYLQNGFKAPIAENACFHWLKNPPFDPYYTPAVQTGGMPPAAHGAAASAPPA